jgi:hypothetical protein
LKGIAAAFFLEETKHMQSAEKSLETEYRGSLTPEMTKLSTLLPAEVSFAADLGLKLAPIPSHRRFVSAALVRVGYATCDKVQLRQFAFEFPFCNWALATDNVAVFEYNPAIGRHSLCELCGGDWDGWRDTLQFRSSGTRFLLFRHDGQLLRVLGPPFVGVRLHTADMVPVPPSRFFTGPQLVWTDPSASIEAIPVWLLEGGDGFSGGNPPPAVPVLPPYASAESNLRYVYNEHLSM